MTFMTKHIVDVTTTKECKIKETYYQDGKRYVDCIKQQWYFFITTSDYAKHKEVLESFKLRFPQFRFEYLKDNEEWHKIYCKYTKRKYIIQLFKKNKIQTYEADLSLNRRYWIDSNHTIAEPQYFNLLFVDIEVDDSVSGLRIGHDTIISFAAKSSNGKEYLFLDTDEKQLLTKIVRLITRYDIIIGWNSRSYDIPYIKQRCELYNIEFPDICHIDMMQRMIHAYRFDTNINSFSLNNIAHKFLGEKKVKRTTKVIDLYNNDFETFKKYNLTDVRLLYNLEQKHKIINMLLIQSTWCNVTPRSLGQSGTGLYTLLDNLLLKETHKRNLKGITPKYTFDELNDMPADEHAALDYVGGKVLKPKIGYYKNTYVFDFKTLYPTIIIASNIGFDTIDPKGEIHNPSGASFKRKPESVFVSVLNVLLKNRKKYKEQKLSLIENNLKNTPEYQTVEANEVIAKELGNSVYGICGAKWGRYFDKQIVESITLMGHWLLNSLQTFFKRRNCQILTGDTDSIIISTNDTIDIDKTLKEYHEYLDTELKAQLNIVKHPIQLDFDKHFSSFIIVAKKNYAGHLINQENRKVNYIFVRGLNSVKSDTCKIVKTLTNELLDKLLKQTHAQSFYIKWLDELFNTVFDNITAEDITIHKKIRKNVAEYKNKPLSVVIAEKQLKNGDVLISNEVEYIVTGRDGTKLDGIATDQFTGEFDKEYYWDNLILPNINRLLSVAFPDIGWSSYTYKYLSVPRLF